VLFRSVKSLLCHKFVSRTQSTLRHFGNTITTLGKMEAPEHWPPVVQEEYEPVRILGKGGFALVVLAKSKSTKRLVAIKVVGGSKMDLDYAHRELEILAHLKHPNVMQLEDSWECEGKPAVMALTYVPGPTLDKLLRCVGAPSMSFCRVVSAQLVDVISFLHSHAVMHRDIKPDNLIITGATQDNVIEDPMEPFSAMLKRWHLTLVDFGFARALGPQDLNVDDSELSSKFLPSHDLERSLNASDRTLSKTIVRRLSALGNRDYAAPEIQKGLKKNSNHERALSNFTSDYGMVADAYSVGSTIRYMLTGVSPDKCINEVIAAERSAIVLLCSCLGKMMSAGSTSKPAKKRKNYRSSGELPTEVVRLVKSMTLADAKQRTSVLTARLYPWINDVFNESARSGPISFLPFMVE